MKFNQTATTRSVAALFVFFLFFAEAISGGTPVATDPSAALCQVVYPLDKSAQDGYRYMFFGNGFFINQRGYLITAAHLLSYFRNGGEPYVLVGPPEGPRHMFEAPIVAADWDHDVAILQAKPNPFESETKIAHLALSASTPPLGQSVQAESLLPPDVLNAHSSAAPLEEVSRGELVDYQFYREEAADLELLLFDHEILSGQSGSPLISAETDSVVGIVIGQWMHPVVVSEGAHAGETRVAPGAALRIHYAISLLEQLHVPWDSAPESSTKAAVSLTDAQSSSTPIPLSLVGAPYPTQALFGDTVLMDARVDQDGKLMDLRVVSGSSPFLEAAVDAVHTWTFSPSPAGGRAVSTRIGIVFQFPQSFLRPATSKGHTYREPFPDSADRGALPSVTVEPDYPLTGDAGDSVILYEYIDAQGRIKSTSVVRGAESLTAAAVSATQQWQFIPARQAGAATDSAAIVVITFRRPTHAHSQ